MVSELDSVYTMYKRDNTGVYELITTIGFLAFSRSNGYLSHVYIRPPYRNMGIFSALLKAFICHVMYITTNNNITCHVKKQNAIMQHILEKHGFTRMGLSRTKNDLLTPLCL